MKNQKLGYILLLLLVCAIFGFGFVAVKYLLLVHMPTFLLLGIRFVIGSSVLLIVRVFKKSPRFQLREYISGFFVGIAIFVGFVFQTSGAAFTTPAKNALFTGLYVVFVPLILSVLKRKFSLKPILLAILSFIGVLIVSDAFTADLSLNLGDCLSILSAFAYAFQFILLEKYSPSFDSVNFTAAQLETIAVLSLIFSACTEMPVYRDIEWTKVILPLLYLGIFSSALALTVQTYVQAKISANSAAIVLCTESAFAVAFSVLFGYDPFTVSLLIGFAVLFAAMLLSSAGNQDTIKTEGSSPPVEALQSTETKSNGDLEE